MDSGKSLHRRNSDNEKKRESSLKLGVETEIQERQTMKLDGGKQKEAENEDMQRVRIKKRHQKVLVVLSS